MNGELILYTGPGCGLCKKAREIIEQVLPSDWKLAEIDISLSEELRQRYGARIPVIAMDDGREKGWPFTTRQVRRLIESCR